ncbi:MAG: hypothetical protein QF554_10655 [Dehalococcoidia bacterium]|jgi:hypothetical protein|nr:hypothetical protein [Dehalococcoidia bacterium]
MLRPFFDYLNTNHAEGPKKWYISACPGDLAKVYLPARGVIYDQGIRFFESYEGVEEVVNGEKVLVNVALFFDASPTIKLFYGHLTLRDEIRAAVESSPNGYVVFDAGTHIGYMYSPSNPVHGVDFGVQDFDIDAGLTRNPEEWWNTRVNPLDYFTEDVREEILASYQATYEGLIEQGTIPYSDLEDSRLSINYQDTLWGIWFKDDLADAFGGIEGGTGWSVVNLQQKADFHQESYWKTLEEFPTMSGLFVEQRRLGVVGKALYEGEPIGINKLYVVTGDDSAGIIRIEEDYGSDPPTHYLKYEVQPGAESRLDELLIMESFGTQEAAEASDFSDQAVTFRREPCRNVDCT